MVCEKNCVKILTNGANDMLDGERCLKDWKKSNLIPIYNRKEDVRSSGNYKILKL